MTIDRRIRLMKIGIVLLAVATAGGVAASVILAPKEFHYAWIAAVAAAMASMSASISELKRRKAAGETEAPRHAGRVQLVGVAILALIAAVSIGFMVASR